VNDAATHCPTCGHSLPKSTSPCPDCGSILAGMIEVAREPLLEEALLPHRLLASAGLHPAFAYEDETEVPHPIEAGEPFTSGGGLMVPVTTTFAVYVPHAEAAEARLILADAREAGKAGGDDDEAATKSPAGSGPRPRTTPRSPGH